MVCINGCVVQFPVLIGSALTEPHLVCIAPPPTMYVYHTQMIIMVYNKTTSQLANTDAVRIHQGMLYEASQNSIEQQHRCQRTCQKSICGRCHVFVDVPLLPVLHLNAALKCGWPSSLPHSLLYASLLGLLIPQCHTATCKGVSCHLHMGTTYTHTPHTLTVMQRHATLCNQPSPQTYNALHGQCMTTGLAKQSLLYMFLNSS